MIGFLHYLWEHLLEVSLFFVGMANVLSIYYLNKLIRILIREMQALREPMR